MDRRPLKVLVATDYYDPPATMGGAAAAKRWAFRLASRGHRIIAVAPSPSRCGSWDQDGPIQILRTPSAPLPHPRAEIRKQYRNVVPLASHSVREAWSRLKPDVVHVHYTLGVGAATVRLARRRRIPVLGTTHSLPENSLYFFGPHLAMSLRRRLPAAYRLAERLWWRSVIGFYDRCDLLTAPAPATLETYRSNGLATPGVCLSNGVDLSAFPASPSEAAAFRRRYGVPGDARMILYVGRMHPEKRVDLLLEAFAHCSPTYAYLVLAGSRDERIDQAVAASPLRARIIQTGYLPDPVDIAAAYAAADVFASASEAGGQGLVFLEAQASGLPVVAADRYATRDAVRHGETGLLFRGGDANDFALKLTRALHDDDLRKRMSEGARRAARGHDIERSVDRLEDLLYGLTLGKLPAVAGAAA